MESDKQISMLANRARLYEFFRAKEPEDGVFSYQAIYDATEIWLNESSGRSAFFSRAVFWRLLYEDLKLVINDRDIGYRVASEEERDAWCKSKGQRARMQTFKRLAGSTFRRWDVLTEGQRNAALNEQKIAALQLRAHDYAEEIISLPPANDPMPSRREMIDVIRGKKA